MKKKLKVKSVYQLVEESVETGINFGISRAYKHTDIPSIDSIKEHLLHEIMLELTEKFDLS